MKLNIFLKSGTKGRARSYLLVLFCGLAALNIYIYQVRVQEGYGVDSVSPSEMLLQQLRQELPRGGRVGFISDGKKAASVSSVERYLLTQYAVAPIVVEEGTSADLVIVNVQKFDPEPIPADLVLVRDFGSGLMLFRKRASDRYLCACIDSPRSRARRVFVDRICVAVDCRSPDTTIATILVVAVARGVSEALSLSQAASSTIAHSFRQTLDLSRTAVRLRVTGDWLCRRLNCPACENASPRNVGCMGSLECSCTLPVSRKRRSLARHIRPRDVWEPE